MTARMPLSRIEDIAALLDGKLKGDEREAVLRALAQDEEAFELFEESVYALEEERDPGLRESDELTEPVALGPRRLGGENGPESSSQRSQQEAQRSFMVRYLTRAAAAATVLVGGFLWLYPASSPAGRLLASFQTLPSAEQLAVPVPRGGTEGGYFEAGRYLFAATAELQRPERAVAAKALRNAAVALGSETSEGREVLMTANQLASEKMSLRTARTRVRRLEKLLSDGESFDLGRWCQAATAALAADDLDFFGKGPVRKQWKRLYAERQQGTRAAELMASIDGLLAAGVEEGDNRERMAPALRALAHHFQQWN